MYVHIAGMELDSMDIWTEPHPSTQPRGRRSRAALGRWSRDARSPALRIAPAAPVPEVTAPLPVLPESGMAASSPPQTQPGEEPIFPVVSKPTITLRPIRQRETMPFVARETACPYLECRSANRRCLSAQPAPISLERQVRYCFGPQHRQCRYYRKARGLPAVPPTQAAFYTAAAVTIVILIVLTGLY